MDLSKAWIEKEFSRAKRFVKQGLVTCKAMGGRGV